MAWTSSLLDAADAVTAALNDAALVEAALSAASGGNVTAFGTAFTAVRKFEVTESLEELQASAGPAVSVVPTGFSGQVATRNADGREEFEIKVVVQKKFAEAGTADSEVPALLLLIDQMVAFFKSAEMKAEMLSACGMALVGWVNAPPFNVPHLSGLRQFTSVIGLTWRCAR